MPHFDTTCTFSAVRNKMDRVNVLNHRTAVERQFQIRFDDTELLSSPQAIHGVVSSLVDIAVAVAVTDRVVRREEEKPCEIQVRLPLHAPDVFRETAVHTRLHDLLYWFTGDYWTFDFTEKRDYKRASQFRLEPENSDRVEVALWSGGLDSAAGLCHRLTNGTADRYVLFGTGSNTQIYEVQQRVAQAVAETFPERLLLKRALITLRETATLPKHSDQRSRGFVFLLLGAVCALLEGQNALHIYENGTGAINLAFREAEVGLDHTRSVHPLSLTAMGELVSSITDCPFTFRNPFLFSTKGQMCSVFTNDVLNLIPAKTVSCDRRHRQKELPTQCGVCSSCLLRRQALEAALVPDETAYVVNYRRSNRVDGSYIRAMLDQVKTLQTLLEGENAWCRLTAHYTDLSTVADRTAVSQNMALPVIQDRLVALYRQYITDWDSARNVVNHTLRRDG